MTRITYSIILLLIWGLTQNCNKKQTITINKTENIMIDKATSLIKTFENKPIYGINFSNTKSTCQFEILVNDIQVFKFLNQKGGLNAYIPINPAIIKSGTQKLKIKLLPSVVKDKLVVYFKENTPFEMSISVGITGKNGILTNEKILYTLPFIPLPEDGLPYWETEIEFEAEVPYEFIGWSKSKDLTKVNDIEEKVFDKFKELQEILKNKDFGAFYSMSKKKEIEICIALYCTKNQIKERTKEFKEAFTEIKAEFQIKKDATVRFYGDGKLVTLKSLKDGSSALSSIIKEDSGNETIDFPVYLHMPQGSDELEIIR